MNDEVKIVIKEIKDENEEDSLVDLLGPIYKETIDYWKQFPEEAKFDCPPRYSTGVKID